VASASDGEPLSVFLGDGEHTWYAVPPGGALDEDLSQRQVERLMLEAVSSPERPAWPEWHRLT